MSIKVVSSTIGQQNPSHVTLSKPYRWRKIPGWQPGDMRYREDAPGSASNIGAEANARRRRARLGQFAAALAELGAPDPACAPNAIVIEAGKRVGVGEKTARSYRTALKRQQQEGRCDG